MDKLHNGLNAMVITRFINADMRDAIRECRWEQRVFAVAVEDQGRSSPVKGYQLFGAFKGAPVNIETY